MLLCTQEAYDASSDHLATQPVGTGPYVVTSLTEGSSCTLTKRDDYWQTGEIAPSMVANYDMIEISYVSEAHRWRLPSRAAMSSSLVRWI